MRAQLNALRISAQTPRKRTQAPRRSRRNANSNSNNLNSVMPVSLPTRLTARDTPQQLDRGSDLLASIPVVINESSPSFPWQQPLVSIVMNPLMTKRLELSASRYQRIRWRSLTFRVDPGASSNASGQYVVAFVRDPEDTPPLDHDDLVRWLIAQQHSKVAKWWQPVTLTVPDNGDNLYTSIQGEDRLWSPGRIMVASLGNMTQSTNIAVWLDWAVLLSEPSVETSSFEANRAITITSELQFTPYPSDSTYAALGRLYSWSGYPKNANFYSLNLDETEFSDFPENQLFKASRPITVFVNPAKNEPFMVVEVDLLQLVTAPTMDGSNEVDHGGVGPTVKTKRILTPVKLVGFGSTAGIFQLGHVLSTSTDPTVYSYFVGGLTGYPAGTQFVPVKFGELRDTKRVETRDLVISGKLVKQPTGRLVSDSPNFNLSDWENTLPLVRLYQSTATPPNPTPNQPTEVIVKGGTLDFIDGVVDVNIVQPNGITYDSSNPFPITSTTPLPVSVLNDTLQVTNIKDSNGNPAALTVSNTAAQPIYITQPSGEALSAFVQNRADAPIYVANPSAHPLQIANAVNNDTGRLSPLHIATDVARPLSIVPGPQRDAQGNFYPLLTQPVMPSGIVEINNGQIGSTTSDWSTVGNAPLPRLQAPSVKLASDAASYQQITRAGG